MTPLRTIMALAALAGGVLAGGALASPALASEANTRLVSCGDVNCLLVSGHRDNAGAVVRINGHHVPVEGKRNWQARLPIETVRQWSVPYARTIEVSLHDPRSQRVVVANEADLPIGLMGHADLASLVISVR